MQLRAISYQLGAGRQSERFSDVYESALAGEGSEWVQKALVDITRLLRFIEDNIDAPPHWVCTSHLNCIFYREDMREYIHEAPGQGVSITIEFTGFEDNYRVGLPIVFDGTHGSIKIFSGDLQSTAKIIGEILNEQISFSIIRK
jgi:hypothetical protein